MIIGTDYPPVMLYKIQLITSELLPIRAGWEIGFFLMVSCGLWEVSI